MSEQRVGDVVVGVLAEGGVLAKPNIVRDLALDLRATRARLAALEPVVRAAVDMREAVRPDGDCTPWDGFEWSPRGERAAERLAAAVDALPEEMRKEFGA